MGVGEVLRRVQADNFGPEIQVQHPRCHILAAHPSPRQLANPEGSAAAYDRPRPPVFRAQEPEENGSSPPIELAKTSSSFRILTLNTWGLPIAPLCFEVRQDTPIRVCLSPGSPPPSFIVLWVAPQSVSACAATRGDRPTSLRRWLHI